MDEISISVLLAVKNGAQFIRASIDSVLNQDYQAFELLISDDNSTDNTIQIINSYADKRITLFSQKKSLGQFGNFNFLLKKSKGKIAHFWSHDDVMHPNCLSETINFYTKNPSIGMSYCSGDYINEKGEVTQEWEYDATPAILDNKLYAKYSLSYGCLAGSISQVAINRDKIGNDYFFKKNLVHSGDFDLWTRIAKNHSIGFIPKKLTSIRNHPNQVSHKAASNYASVVEGINITNMLFDLAKVSSEVKRKTKRELILIHYFQRIVVLLIRKEFRLFFSGLNLLKKEDNLVLVFFAWFKFRLRNRKTFLLHRKKIISHLIN
ncbi:glycosyltransferase [Pedobacter miscanthi]|uniref:Glycosyltransferase 2-like domain-containing protein n=1 Tax=Pedobacter miscanthi TaxID=2259170 RepID=A0A366L800_9SPHI|nr:glycosyltransferase [Pedobacter miscanthi]RBQ09997.1 hypothetical protein DRW42_06045 [Pedobacter miscanthi]